MRAAGASSPVILPKLVMPGGQTSYLIIVLAGRLAFIDYQYLYFTYTYPIPITHLYLTNHTYHVKRE